MKRGIKMRILICDDDALIIEQLQKYIRDFFENISVKCPELVCFSDGDIQLHARKNQRQLKPDRQANERNGQRV